MNAVHYFCGKREVYISEQEFCDLYEGPIQGKIILLDKGNNSCSERGLEIAAYRNCNGLLAIIETFPEGVSEEEITKERVVISPDGFWTLHEKGMLNEEGLKIALEDKI